MKYVLLLALLLSACAPGQRNEMDAPALALTARPAPEWTALFERKTGWLAADGIYSVPLSDSLTLFYFSDTILGDGRGERIRGLQFINNSVALLEGSRPDSGNIEFFWRSSPGATPAQDTSTVFVPRTSGAGSEDWYWLGDGFRNHALSDTTYVFAYRMTRTEGSGIFNFAPLGVALLAIPPGSQPPFSDHVQREPLFSYLQQRRGERRFSDRASWRTPPRPARRSRTATSTSTASTKRTKGSWRPASSWRPLSTSARGASGTAVPGRRR